MIQLQQIAVFALILGFSQHSNAQAVVASSGLGQKVVVVTGARFSYKLLERWIDEYTAGNPDVQIIVESRGTADPLRYDILAEVYEHPDDIRARREYLYVGRYAILPVASSRSAFAQEYAVKGMNQDMFRRVFFDDIFAEKTTKNSDAIPFTVYTRMQKAGVPSVFARYFGYQQKDIRGTGIAGADSHLLKALLRDSTGVTYLPVPLAYDEATRQPVQGITPLPPDINGNKKISTDEKFYENLDEVLAQLERRAGKEVKNIPLEYLHLSVDRDCATPEAINFLKWIKQNGRQYLNNYGFLKPEDTDVHDEAFNDFAARRVK